jgi:hypothetical protein
MFESTTAENFQSWDRFLGAYFEPIRTALGLIPFIGEAKADELAQSFFVKMYNRGLLQKRPAIQGRFRDWLYVAARRHAIDEWRKLQRRPEHPISFALEPVDPREPGPDEAAFDADELYALSILHLTVSRVRRQLIEEGKGEHWTIFDELVLAPLFPGRAPRTREDLLSRFPGQQPVFLDNRVTTVKRIFRRILPALVPPDPTENLTPQQRLEELFSILQRSRSSRLWLAFLEDPRPRLDESSGSSVDVGAWSSCLKDSSEGVAQEILDDELRVLLGFWLDMPLSDYLDRLESIGPGLAAIVRESRPSGLRGRAGSGPSSTLKTFVAGTDPLISQLPRGELGKLLERIKLFAKQVHRSARSEGKRHDAQGVARRAHSMPMEVAQVLYNLAGALALLHCGTRIIGLGDDRYRKNLAWVLDQPWVDTKLHPVFLAAVQRLHSSGRP